MSIPCDKITDCPRGRVCVNNQCVRRGKAKNVKIQAFLEQRKKRVPGGWKHEQGTEAIVAEAKQKVKSVPKHISCDRSDKAQWYQNVVSKFMSPSSTVHRLLVAHQLGTGKTRSMLQMIANFYKDERPIVVLVPRQSLVDNFYDELFKHATPLRAYLYRCLGKPPQDPKEMKAFRTKCVELLEKKGRIRNGVVSRGKCKDEPAAPIRCFRYTVAGAPAFRNQAIFKVARRLGTGGGERGSVFDNTVVMVDEGHLLTQASSWEPTQRQGIKRLGDALRRAKNVKLGVFTATPVVDSRSDAVELMKIVQATETERYFPGYVSWFMDRVGGVFAKTTPTDAVPKIVRVPLMGKNKEVYEKAVGKKGAQKASQYTTEHMASGQYWTYGKLLREVKSGSDFSGVATKLDAIANEVKSSGVKTCVLIHKQNGLAMLQDILRAKGVTVASAVGAKSGESVKAVGAANAETIRKFNAVSNIDGDTTRCLLLDAKEFSEGVSLRNVRSIVLADLEDGLKPPTWGRVKQRIGRALRFCSHDELPPAKRTLDIKLFVATHPTVETIDSRKTSALLKQIPLVEGAMCELEAVALDRGVYGPSVCSKSRSRGSSAFVSATSSAFPVKITR